MANENDLGFSLRKEEILKKLMEYSPGKNNAQEDLSLRKDIEKIISDYETLSEETKREFPKDEIDFKYDLICNHVPLQ